MKCKRRVFTGPAKYVNPRTIISFKQHILFPLSSKFISCNSIILSMPLLPTAIIFTCVQQLYEGINRCFGHIMKILTGDRTVVGRQLGQVGNTLIPLSEWINRIWCVTSDHFRYSCNLPQTHRTEPYLLEHLK